MQTLSTELRGVIENRLRSANQREILVIASALCAQELEIPGAAHARGPQLAAPAAASDGLRFTVDNYVVRDRTTGLSWTRQNIGGKALKWAEAKAACEACRIGGFEDWRLPTIQELLTLVDYSRTSPAIDAAFQCDSEWYWTGTPAASSSGCAWVVYFSYGDSSYGSQNDEYRVRAVRPGQLVGTLGLS